MSLVHDLWAKLEMEFKKPGGCTIHKHISWRHAEKISITVVRDEIDKIAEQYGRKLKWIKFTPLENGGVLMEASIPPIKM